MIKTIVMTFLEVEMMKLSKFFISTAAILLMIATAGCNLSLPGHTAPTAFVFPTPNLTMTALFSSTLEIPPTATPPAVRTATTQPGQATATPLPQATATALAQAATATSTAAAASATTGPTATTAPSITTTPTGPVQNTLGLFVSAAPNLNGDWSEWKAIEYPAKYVAFVNSAHPGSSGLQAAYRVSWDASYLYLAVKVKDATYVQNATGANLYKGDSIELLLDTNPSGDAGVQSLTKDDYQLGISAGSPSVGANPEVYLWFPTSKTGSRTDVKIGTNTSAGYYRIEAAIPWSLFGVTPTNGMTFGFALSVSDDDSAGTSRQERMVSSVPNRVLTDPTTWGMLTLTQ